MTDPSLLMLAGEPIRDQRTMVGFDPQIGPWKTVEEVELAWQAWADQHGLTIRRRQGDYSTNLVKSRKTVVAYVSGAKWIADCPTCNGGVSCWHENERGCCLDCGTIYHVDMPDDDERERAERALAIRAPEDRHWHRHRGETVGDLERENSLLAAAGPGARVDKTISIEAIRDVLGDKALKKLERAGKL